MLETATGREALRLAGGGPQLVLLDVDLADINGFEVRRRIKANPQTAAIPVVHLSASYGSRSTASIGSRPSADPCRGAQPRSIE